MAIELPLRVAMITTTTGTGPITCVAGTNDKRTINTHLGNSGTHRVMYGLSGTGGNLYHEVGYGDYNCATNVLTRSTILSAAPTNPATLAGTSDVFLFIVPWFSPVVQWTGTKTLGLDEIAAMVEFTDTSANGTLNLPALANVPDGFGFPWANTGTKVFDFDPNAAELIEGASTLRVFPGERGFCWASKPPGAGSTLWRVSFTTRGPVLIKPLAFSNVLQADITDFFDAAFDNYELKIARLFPRNSTGTSFWAMRVGTGAGPTWQTSGYKYAHTIIQPNAAASSGGSGATLDNFTGAIALSRQPNGSNNPSVLYPAAGTIEFANPDNAERFSCEYSLRYRRTDDEILRAIGVGEFSTAAAITGLRFILGVGGTDFLDLDGGLYGWRKA